MRTEKTWRFLAAATLLLAAYGWVLVRHAAFAVGGSDSSGYINAARRLATGRLVERPRSLDRLGLPDDQAQVCIPLGFLTGPRPGTMAPLYPPGFPAHLLGAAAIAGWKTGPFLVSPLAALLCLIVFYLLGRDFGLTGFAAGLATAILAAWSIFLFQALQPMGDIVATLWSVGAVLCARRARSGPAWALAAGAAFAMAVAVRPTNALLLFPLALALPMTRRTLALFVTGSIPLAGGFAAYNLACHGNVIKTGYGEIRLLHSFALSNFSPRFRYYSLQLLRTLTPLVPLAWLALPVEKNTRVRDRWLLVSWFAGYLLLFSFYGPYESLIFVRFLLPGIPALILGAALVASRLSRGLRLQPWTTAILGIGILVLEIRAARRDNVVGIVQSQSTYPGASLWAASTLPRDSVVLAFQISGSLEYYTDLTYVRWDYFTPDSFTSFRGRVETARYHVMALLFPFEREEILKHAPGNWKRIGSFREVDLWELTP